LLAEGVCERAFESESSRTVGSESDTFDRDRCK
jgi:hypothetical protein